MSEEFLSLFITVRDGMYYFRAREIFKNLGYEYRQRERGFNGTGAVFLKQIPDGMKIGHGYQTFLSYDGVCEVFKLAQGGDVAFTVRRWGEKAEKRLKFMQFFFDNFSSEVCRRSGAEIKNPQFEHLLKMRRSDSMTDEQRYEIASELLRTVTALQDAFAYAQHAEQLARQAGQGSERMKLSDLRRQINNAVTHAAIIRESLKSQETEKIWC